MPDINFALLDAAIEDAANGAGGAVHDQAVWVGTVEGTQHSARCGTSSASTRTPAGATCVTPVSRSPRICGSPTMTTEPIVYLVQSTKGWDWATFDRDVAMDQLGPMFYDGTQRRWRCWDGSTLSAYRWVPLGTHAEDRAGSGMEVA